MKCPFFFPPPPPPPRAAVEAEEELDELSDETLAPNGEVLIGFTRVFSGVLRPGMTRGGGGGMNVW